MYIYKHVLTHDTVEIYRLTQQRDRDIFWSDRIKYYCIFRLLNTSAERKTFPSRRTQLRNGSVSTVKKSIFSHFAYQNTFLDDSLRDKEILVIHSHAQFLTIYGRRWLFIEAGPVKWRRRIGRCLWHAVIRGGATSYVVRSGPCARYRRWRHSASVLNFSKFST